MITEDLKRTEQRVFRAAVDTGLWDILLASVVAMFSIAPLLSGSLGDFWSAVIFLPVWAAVYVGLRIVRERAVLPRVGVVRFGPDRRQRLRRFSRVMLGVNVIAFLVGIVAAAVIQHDSREIWVFPAAFSLIMLVVFSVSACLLSIRRLFLYGALIAVAPLIGEVLYRRGYASDHGFPVVFGVVALAIAGVGLARLVSILTRPPFPSEQSVGSHGG